MSITNRHGNKVVLPRQREGFWEAVEDVYAGDDAQAWRRMAMLTLKEVAGWPVERIALMLGQRPSYVRDCITEVKHDLRRRFKPRCDA